MTTDQQLESRLRDLLKRRSEANKEAEKMKAKLEILREEETKILQKMEELGVTPETIENEISLLENEIADSLKVLEREIEQAELKIQTYKGCKNES